MRHRIATLILPGLLLGLLAACGGSSDPAQPPGSAPAAPKATGLAYTDPTGTGWRLVRDASSTATRLVLNLVGPVGTRSRGVGFNLKGGAGVTFGTFSNGWHAHDTGVFDLLNRHRHSEWSLPPDPEPVFFAAGVKPGNLLTVGIFQKDRLIDAKAVSSPVVQVAIELPESTSLAVGDAVALAIPKARMIPEDIGTMDQNGWYNEVEVITKSKAQDISIAVGTLKAQ